MNAADWVIIGVIGVSALVSILRGFAREAFSLASWVLALVIALVFHPSFAQLLSPHISLPSARVVTAFVTLFLVTLMVGSLLGALAAHLFKASGLGGLDRVLGMAFGVARGLVLIMALLILVPPVVPVQQDPWWQQSRLIPHLLLMQGWFTETSRSLWALISNSAPAQAVKQQVPALPVAR